MSHIKYLKTVCDRRTSALKMIASNKWGAGRKSLRTVYLNFIRSKLEYGAIIYGELSQKVFRILEVIQNNNLRCILGVRKTTPISSMEVDAFVPPLDLRFRYLSIKFYIQLLYRNKEDATRKELNIVSLEEHSGKGPYMERIGSIAKVMKIERLSGDETRTVGPISPMLDMDVINIDSLWEGENDSNIQHGRVVEESIRAKYPGCKEFYTDGSKLESGSTSAGLYISDAEKGVSWLMNPGHSVPGAELFAIRKALEYIGEHEKSTNSVVLSDSRVALQLISNRNAKTYKKVVNDIQEMIIENKEHINLQWVQGHRGLRGNQIADGLVKEGHNNNKSVLTRLSKEEQMSFINGSFYEYWRVVWRSRMILSNKGKFYGNIISDIKYRPWFNHKSQRIESVMARLRTGHVGVAWQACHMKRFNMSDTEMCEVCATTDTVEHFLLNCTKFEAARQVMRARLRGVRVECTLRNLLSGGTFESFIQREIVRSLAEFIKTTGRMNEL